MGLNVRSSVATFKRGIRRTLPEYEQTHGHVDKDPGKAQKLDQVVHEKKAFLQAKKSCQHLRVMNEYFTTIFSTLATKNVLTVLSDSRLNADFIYSLLL